MKDIISAIGVLKGLKHYVRRVSSGYISFLELKKCCGGLDPLTLLQEKKDTLK